MTTEHQPQNERDVGGTGPQAGDGQSSRRLTPQPRAASVSKQHSSLVNDIRCRLIEYQEYADEDAIRPNVHPSVALEALASLEEQYEDVCRQGLILRERVNGLEEQLEAAREALSACGDVLFGTWDDDAARVVASREAEALTRDVLFPATNLPASHDSSETGRGMEMATVRPPANPASERP